MCLQLDDDDDDEKEEEGELRNLYSSRNIIGGIKSRRMRWAMHVARVKGLKTTYKYFVGNP